MVPSLINIKFKDHVVVAVGLQVTDCKDDIRIFLASAQQDFFAFVSLKKRNAKHSLHFFIIYIIINKYF